MRRRALNATALVLSLSACGDEGGDEGPPTAPPCADNGAFVDLDLAGAAERSVRWDAANLLECHGGTVQSASLQFNAGPGAPKGDLSVRLATQQEVAVGADLAASVSLDLESPDLLVRWNQGCVAQITAVADVVRVVASDSFLGVWSVYDGSVRCDVPVTALLSSDAYTLPRADFRGLFYRLEAR